MRCKPGDLAIIVGGTLGNHGHIVEVISLYQDDRWLVKTNVPINGSVYGVIQPTREGTIKDAYLMPIRPDQMEEDEKEDQPIEEPINA